jgi:predicted  nucleic acid-binding Zn-ribbon protein
MLKITRDQIERLVKLQQIETDKKRIKATLANLPDQLAELDIRLDHAAKAVNNKETLLKDYEQKYRSYESDTETNLLKIKKSEEKLEVAKNNKEYQSSLKEIHELKNKISRIEDDMIECLDRMEEIERDIKSRKEDYNKIAQKINIEKNIIKNQAKNDEHNLLELHAERANIIESVQKDLIEKFFIIQKKQTNSIAIAKAKNSICYGCNMNIPPQMYNDLQRCDSLAFCPFCDRILYWEQEKTDNAV